MLQKYNRYKVLKVFLESPLEKFGLREISKMTKISPVSVMNYLKEFEKEELIKKETRKNLPVYSGMRDNSKFIFYKKLSILSELNNSGVVEYIWEKVSPQAIVLYGSFARGESIENSDIDLFILGKEIPIKLENFEKILNKKIHLLFSETLREVRKELKNNILNGIILSGYIKVFE